MKEINRNALEEIIRKRFFYGISFSPYGGVSGLYDYGPIGCALQNNIVDIWRKHFVLEESMLEVDCSIMTPHDVLQTSGHVERFADLMCKDTVNGEIYRVDHLVESELSNLLEVKATSAKAQKLKDKRAASQRDPLTDEQKQEISDVLAKLDNYGLAELEAIIKKFDIKSPHGNPLTKPEVFNLMFGSQIGPTGTLKAYLRPETAQGQFLNFKRLLEFNNEKMPFASASIGKSFRNEISPKSGLLRVREFLMAEIEHFVHPKQKAHPKFDKVKGVVLSLLPAEVQMSGKTDPIKMTIGDAVSQKLVNNETIGYFMARIHLFLERIGIDMDRVRFRQHMGNEMAHYACDCWDAEIHGSYGWIECVGCADRSAFDLTRHAEKTKEKLIARLSLPEPVTVQKMVFEKNGKAFGPAFRKEAKTIESLLLGFSELQLKELKAALDSSGEYTLKYEEGKEAKLTKELVTVSEVSETVHVEEYVPNVVEPSFGIGRILYSLLEHTWYVREGDDQRNVFKFPVTVSPYKCLIVPLSKNVTFNDSVAKVNDLLTQQGVPTKVDDSAGQIGRRYSRNDELGACYGITVDFQTLEDGTVTLRERDTMVQVRAKLEVICSTVSELCSQRTTWAEVTKSLPIFRE